MMKITNTPLSGLIIIDPIIHTDQRGFFFETFQQERYTDLGIPPFVQDNISRSKQHTLRGLNYQLPRSQGKLIWAIRGAIWDVVIDIRKNSKTFGQSFSIKLNDENHTQFYIPPGFAHGFCVLSNEADIYYKCTDFYMPACEHGILWNDPDLNISWPSSQPVLSAKDAKYPPLREIAQEHLFA